MASKYFHYATGDFLFGTNDHKRTKEEKESGKELAVETITTPPHPSHERRKGRAEEKIDLSFPLKTPPVKPVKQHHAWEPKFNGLLDQKETASNDRSVARIIAEETANYSKSHWVEAKNLKAQGPHLPEPSPLRLSQTRAQLATQSNNKKKTRRHSEPIKSVVNLEDEPYKKRVLSLLGHAPPASKRRFSEPLPIKRANDEKDPKALMNRTESFQEITAVREAFSNLSLEEKSGEKQSATERMTAEEFLAEEKTVEDTVPKETPAVEVKRRPSWFKQTFDRIFRKRKTSVVEMTAIAPVQTQAENIAQDKHVMLRELPEQTHKLEELFRSESCLTRWLEVARDPELTLHNYRALTAKVRTQPRGNAFKSMQTRLISAIRETHLLRHNLPMDYSPEAFCGILIACCVELPAQSIPLDSFLLLQEEQCYELACNLLFSKKYALAQVYTREGLRKWCLVLDRLLDHETSVKAPRKTSISWAAEWLQSCCILALDTANVQASRDILQQIVLNGQVEVFRLAVACTQSKRFDDILNDILPSLQHITTEQICKLLSSYAFDFSLQLKSEKALLRRLERDREDLACVLQCMHCLEIQVRKMHSDLGRLRRSVAYHRQRERALSRGQL